MRIFCIVILAISLFGCASTHNFATDGNNVLGGGYLESKIHDGVYHITVKTNWAPWVRTSAARSAWQTRAQTLCGSEKFRELQIKESSYEPISAYQGIVPYIVTVREGFAVCDSANLSEEAALALIHKR